MSEQLIIAGILFHACSGIPGLFLRKTADSGQKLSVALALTGSGAGIAGALLAAFQPATTNGLTRIDGITIAFIIPILFIAGLGSLYGLEYWSQASHPQNGRKLRLFYGLVTAALATITVAAHSLLFLAAWEIMALSAFFLVTTEDESRAAREAGWIYLVATHFSTLCLFALFALLRTTTGTYALGPLEAGTATPITLTTLFLLAFLAFGCKAGVMPLHIWLPGAHAMAPSHVSALMSGVLIKIGIYGFVRIIAWLPDPPLWWAGITLALGATSGVLGVVLALGQHDLKRLLAYHSIENIGIIVMGLGIALAGRSIQSAPLVVLGLAGALLHVWNHGLFKALLFLGAGSVIHATHTRDLEHLGGLATKLPITALSFAVGAVAICGLPPLNGFVSELLIYIGAFRSMGVGQTATYGAAAFVAPALALIGALAVACFVKAFGVVFLGSPRSHQHQHAHEPGWPMTGPMLALSACCLAIGVAPAAVAPLLDKAVADWSTSLTLHTPALRSLVPLGAISLCAVTLLALLGLAWRALYELRKRHGAPQALTWDCGYAAPTPRMQYTASSFAQWLDSLFHWAQLPLVQTPPKLALFPGQSRFRTHALDAVLDRALKPAFRYGANRLASFRFLQAGNIHAYLFYIFVFLILLLLWR